MSDHLPPRTRQENLQRRNERQTIPNYEGLAGWGLIGLALVLIFTSAPPGVINGALIIGVVLLLTGTVMVDRAITGRTS